MSEHIQPYFDAHSATSAPMADVPGHTPGVAHESEHLDFRPIVWSGFGLIVMCTVVTALVWWLFAGLEKFNAQPVGTVSSLAIEDADRPFGQRLDNVPSPHLEGIERESSIISVRTRNGAEMSFFASADINVSIGEKEKASLFELHEGQLVTLVYYMPSGETGGIGVVAAIVSPPAKAKEAKIESEQPDSTRSLLAEIIKVEPRSVAASREWAEVQMNRYGWTDRNDGIVHIPVERAMESVLQSNEFRVEADKKKGNGRPKIPSRSNSGRTMGGAQ
jgi:hypothetical protein